MIKKIFQSISALLFLLFTLLIGLLPFRILYIVSDFVAWVLRRVIGYRYKLVANNLTLTDIELTPDQKKLLIKEIYRNLSDILLEGIKSFSMNRATVIERHKLINPEILEPFYQQGRCIILVTGHIGNWEWGSLSAGIQTPYRIIGFYKPLKNKYINNILKKSRSKFGTILSPIRQTTLSFETYKEIPSMFMMAADQSPSKIEQAHWMKFLGRDTAFLHGPAKHAILNNYPVVFTEINRVKRGYYELNLSILCENPIEMNPMGLTELYVKKLESTIRKNPSSWLWTHRRWKHQPPAGTN